MLRFRLGVKYEGHGDYHFESSNPLSGHVHIKTGLLRKKLGISIRGRNREANRSIVFFGVFIFLSFLLGSSDAPLGTVGLITKQYAEIIAIALLLVNLIIGALSLIGLRDSWRVGV